MQRLRALIARRQGWLAVLIVFVLAVRLVVPTGFMPTVEHGRLALRLCPGTAPASTVATAMPGMHHGRPDAPKHDKTEAPCAFAGIGVATLGTVDPARLLAAIVFAFLLTARAVPRFGPAPPGRLRPPLRAPPLPA